MEAPEPGRRLYHPPTKPEFHALKQKLEHEWVPAVQQLLEIATENLLIILNLQCLILLMRQRFGYR